MADKISDNVGKKIVEALKMQRQGDIQSDIDMPSNLIDSSVSKSAYDSNEDNYIEQDLSQEDSQSDMMQDDAHYDSDIDSIFQNNLNQNLRVSAPINSASIDFELPDNVAILNRLIAKLPVGVSKQTGAIIITQTMEALGISINSVLEEAKEVQNSLTLSARECQKAIIDCRKQISELELKAQKYQKQAVTMNDVINLFKHS